jgi:hypothetical protein
VNARRAGTVRQPHPLLYELSGSLVTDRFQMDGHPAGRRYFGHDFDICNASVRPQRSHWRWFVLHYESLNRKWFFSPRQKRGLFFLHGLPG